MSTSLNLTQTSTVHVVSIRDATPDGGLLSFDLADVLDALGPSVRDYVWILLPGLDCIGPEGQGVCDAIEAARGEGRYLILPGEELLHASRGFVQTVDGAFIGVPSDEYHERELDTLVDLGLFPHTRARLVVMAIDSSLFEVYTKDAGCVSALRERFGDVREEDPEDYFRDAHGDWSSPDTRGQR